MRTRTLIVIVVGAEMAGLLPSANVAALLPQLSDLWALSGAEAGWLAGVYALGYMAAVPFLMALTDRMDARRIFLAGSAVATLTQLGLFLLADGFWSGMVWRALGGAAFAGVYMPGLRMLTDRLHGGETSRAVTLYTASYSVGLGLSYVLSGGLYEWLGLQAMFGLCAGGPALTFLLAWLMLRPVAAPASAGISVLDWRPVFRNRAAMAYILAYGAHCFELAAQRAWITAYLLFALLQAQVDNATLVAALIAAGLTTVGLPSSVTGNELALRFGRNRTVSWILGASCLVACFSGAALLLPLWATIAFCVLHAATVTADSGAITSGAVAAARPGEAGITLALHSTVGFGTSAIAPFAVGLAFDLAGGSDRPWQWGLGFAVMGLGALCGPLALWWFSRPLPLRAG